MYPFTHILKAIARHCRWFLWCGLLNKLPFCSFLVLKGQCHEIVDFRIFHESVSPKPLSIPLGSFPIVQNFAEIFAAHGALTVSTTPLANNGHNGTTYTLPPVSLIPVVLLDFPIYTRIFETIWNDPNVIFSGLGADDSWIKPKLKISWHCPLKLVTLSLKVKVNQIFGPLTDVLLVVQSLTNCLLRQIAVRHSNRLPGCWRHHRAGHIRDRLLGMFLPWTNYL